MFGWVRIISRLLDETAREARRDIRELTDRMRGVGNLHEAPTVRMLFTPGVEEKNIVRGVTHGGVEVLFTPDNVRISSRAKDGLIVFPPGPDGVFQTRTRGSDDLPNLGVPLGNFAMHARSKDGVIRSEERDMTLSDIMPGKTNAPWIVDPVLNVQARLPRSHFAMRIHDADHVIIEVAGLGERHEVRVAPGELAKVLRARYPDPPQVWNRGWSNPNYQGPAVHIVWTGAVQPEHRLRGLPLPGPAVQALMRAYRGENIFWEGLRNGVF